jgi:hypothetical protein
MQCAALARFVRLDAEGTGRSLKLDVGTYRLVEHDYGIVVQFQITPELTGTD